MGTTSEARYELHPDLQEQAALLRAWGGYRITPLPSNHCLNHVADRLLLELPFCFEVLRWQVWICKPSEVLAQLSGGQVTANLTVSSQLPVPPGMHSLMAVLGLHRCMPRLCAVVMPLAEVLGCTVLSSRVGLSMLVARVSGFHCTDLLP